LYGVLSKNWGFICYNTPLKKNEVFMESKEVLKRQAADFSVLLVCNNENRQEQLNTHLKQFFKTILIQTNGVSALDVFKKEHPHIVITDLDLPQLSGHELIENIKKLNILTPIIVVSQKSDKKTLLETMHLGITDFIPNLDFELLNAALEKSIALLKTAQQEEEQVQANDEIKALETLYERKEELKLLSHYKGIPIIHSGTIVNVFENSVEIQTRKVQTKAIEFNKQTILKSPSLSLCIEAHLVDVNNKNAQVVLNHLKFIDYTPQRRKEARIEPSSDMKLMAYKKGGSKINIELKNISIKTLTFEIEEVPDFFKVGTFIDLKIAFQTPENDLAYYVDKLSIINFQGKILSILEQKNSHIVAVEFKMPKNKEEIFNQYLYHREIELIEEFKKIVAKK
jgi:FixJ family two-component response regulator